MNSIIIYFTENEVPVFCGILYKKKRYVHNGVLAAEAALYKLAILADNNEIFFCYNQQTLNILLAKATSLKNFQVCNKEVRSNSIDSHNKLVLVLFVNNKRIIIKMIQSFINCSIVEIYHILDKSWSPLQKEFDNDAILFFYKRDSRVFSFFLKRLDFYLTQINPDWQLQNSIAQIAFIYLKTYVKQAAHVLYTDRHVFELLKTSFRGGRNELFSPGVHENITVLDFKSLYNKLLLQEFPVGNPTFVQNLQEINLPGFYHVTVTSCIQLPILAQKKNSKVIYTNETFSGLFWYEELLLFKKHGGQILKINYGLIYPDKQAIFKDFAEICLKKRTSAAPLEKILYKTIVNSALGYLGFHSTNSQSQLYRNIAIPTIVASKGRIAWYQQYIHLVHTIGCVCVYTDTDSFFIKNISQTFQPDPSIFNIEKFKTVVFFEKKKYIAITQAGCYKYVGVTSNLTLPAAITYISAQQI